MNIGIGGSSNSGKSTLAIKLVEALGKDRAIHLCQDDYVFPKEELRIINNHTDWEYPATINFSNFMKAVEKANQNYQYIICEGIFAFNFEALNNIYDYKIMLDIDYKTFLQRKRKDHRWGVEPEWYIQHIWNSMLQWNKNIDRSNLIHINAQQEIDTRQLLKEMKIEKAIKAI